MYLCNQVYIVTNVIFPLVIYVTFLIISFLFKSHQPIGTMVECSAMV